MRSRAPGAAHAALEHRGHVELLADRAQVLAPALEREARRARRDAQPLDLREGVQDLLGDAVGEVLVVGAARGSRTAAPRSTSRAPRRPCPPPAATLRPARAARRGCRAAAPRRPCAGSVAGPRAPAAACPAGSAAQSGSRSRMRAITSETVSPANAGRPARHSNSTQPNDHTSVRRSTGLPRACSGLM